MKGDPDIFRRCILDESRTRFRVRLGADELKSPQLLSWLMQWIDSLQLEQRKVQEIYLVVSELFNNALDHGILGLDSMLKADEDGFDSYFRLREERLLQLQHGEIGVEFEKIDEHGASLLQIRISNDESGGHANTTWGNDSPADNPFGRGILLVKSFCQQLHYSPEGNEAVALYRLK